jgi:hypothetical protein
MLAPRDDWRFLPTDAQNLPIAFCAIADSASAAFSPIRTLLQLEFNLSTAPQEHLPCPVARRFSSLRSHP